MLEAIIENVSFSLYLLSSLISDSQSAAINSHERKMKSKFLVGGSIVLHYVRVSGKGAYKRMMIIVGKVFFYDGHGKWKFLTVVVKLHIM